MLLVVKYGGSSLASPPLIRRAADRLARLKSAGHSIVVVVSAMGQSTDHLIRLAHRTVKHPPRRELDMLLTAGERVSMSLLAMSLDEFGVSAISFTGSQSGILTTGHHTEARILAVRPQRIRESLDQGKVVIVAGFQGVSAAREITTLGRGGSDTTAVAIAATLGADLCEILTDVDGLFTADPRHVPNARVLPHCPYEQALELARLGAKMHDRSIDLARRYRIALRIRSSHGEKEGTLLHTAHEKENMEATVIRGVATKSGFAYFTAQASLAWLAETLSAQTIPLRFFCANGERIAFLVEKDRHPLVQRIFAEQRVAFTEPTDAGLASIAGEGLSGATDELPRFLRALTAAAGEPFFVITNAMSFSAAVPEAALPAAARALHAEFLEKVSA